jgi:plasmid stability protein
MSDRDKYPSEQAERFIVRMPAGMREQLRFAADRNGRSMNAEVVDRLERSFAEPGTASELLHQIVEHAETASALVAASEAKIWEAVDTVLSGTASPDFIAKLRPNLPSRQRAYFQLFEKLEAARASGDKKVAAECHAALNAMEREDIAATGEVPPYVYSLWNKYGATL